MPKPKKQTAVRGRDAMTQVIAVFDKVTHPSLMFQKDYIDFTRELIADLEIRLEAAEQEEKERKERERD